MHNEAVAVKPSMKRRKKSSPALAMLIVFGVIAAALSMGAFVFYAQNLPSKNGKPTEAKKEPVAKVTVAKLNAAYDNNEVRANALLKGRLVSITGTVGSVSSDILGENYITINDASDKFGIAAVQCYFPKSAITDMVKLNKGDTVTVVGRCAGRPLLGVMLKDCTIVATE